MAWHGPRGDCGCCGIEPPPPDCACPENDCTPEGKTQFSSVKSIVEWDDEFLITEERNFITTARSCVCADTAEYYARGYSGLSAANGTYDAAYVKPDGSEWVEADVDTDCGWWFFPILEIDLEYTDTFTRTYYNGCDPNVAFSGSRTIPVYFYTNTGRFETKIDAFPQIRLETLSGLGTPPGRTFTRIWTPYECKPEDEGYTLSGEFGVVANTDPTFFIQFANGNGYTDSPIGPSLTIPGVGLLSGDRIVTYNGQLGTVTPYYRGGRVGFNLSCVIGNQSIDNTLDAFSWTYTIFRTCGFYEVPGSGVLEWNVFNRKHSILLNA